MRERKKFPFVTLGLILINALIFVILEATGTSEQVCKNYGFRPAAVLQGGFALLTFFTGMFLHGGGFFHLFGNMLALLVFGTILERRMGGRRFLAIYVIAHVVAKTFDLAVRPDSWIPATGASAAISGVVGACLSGYPTARAPLAYLLMMSLVSFLIAILIFALAPFATAPLWPFVLIWLGFQLLAGLIVATRPITGGVGYWSHISGFLAGMLLCLLLKPGEPEEEFALPEEIPAIRSI